MEEPLSDEPDDVDEADGSVAVGVDLEVVVVEAASIRGRDVVVEEGDVIVVDLSKREGVCTTA